MLFAWLVVFHKVLFVASLKTSQPEDSQIGGYWNDDGNDDVNDTYYQGEFEAAQQQQSKLGDLKLAGNCGDCDFTFDVSCLYKRKVRMGFYHRFADCLVPSYGLLEEARKSLGKGKVCLVTSPGFNVLSTFRQMIKLDKFVLFTEDEECVRSLPLVSIDARSVKRADAWYVNGYPHKVWPNARAFLPIDLEANMKALHRDAVKIATPVLDSSLVLVVRYKTARAFTQKTWVDLKAAMMDIAASAPPGSSRKPTYVEHYGNHDTLLDTVNKFVNAAGVVGYHGAGLANALFAKQKSCVMEILPLGRHKQQWRSNDELARLSSTLVWDKLYIKFADMLKANPSASHFWTGSTEDQFFKQLPWVELPDSGVADFKSKFSACLHEHVF